MLLGFRLVWVKGKGSKIVPSGMPTQSCFNNNLGTSLCIGDGVTVFQLNPKKRTDAGQIYGAEVPYLAGKGVPCIGMGLPVVTSPPHDNTPLRLTGRRVHYVPL